MGTRDPRVDAYIERAAAFAQPVMNHLRELVHAACPDVVETMKWSFPHFMYGGGILCSMASFKQHCAFGFWKGSLILGKDQGDGAEQVDAMGQFGRLTALADLPNNRTMTRYIKAAMKLNDEGVKVPARTRSTEKKELEVPPYFTAALKKNRKAHATFEKFPYSKRKDYIEWITEAKSEATRQRRLETALEWLAEGKARHWKYEKC